MPLHPALDRLIRNKLAHARAPQWAMPIDEVRRSFRDLWTPAITGEAAAIAHVEDAMIPRASDARGPAMANGDDAMRARIYTPKSGDVHPPLLYFHGGGYVKGGIEESDTFCRNLANATAHVVVSVDYRLAPEHPFPAAHDDAYAAAAWLCAHACELGAMQGRVVVCGESAGGNLAAATCLRARGDARIAIPHQVLLQPVVDFTMSSASMTLSASQCLVPREDLAWYYRTYLRDGDPRDARVSPLHAPDLSKLPPALIIAAEYDTLRDEAQAFAVRLAASGVAAQYRCYPGMVHGFLQMGALVAQARAALDEIARTLNASRPRPC